MNDVRIYNDQGRDEGEDRPQIFYVREESKTNLKIIPILLSALGISVTFVGLVYTAFHNFSTDVSTNLEGFETRASKVIDAQNRRIERLEDRLTECERWSVRSR